MASYREYELKGLSARHFQDNNDIVLIPKGLPKRYVSKIISKLETVLQVKSTSKNKDGSITISLDKNTGPNTDELLRSIGFKGGQEKGDIISQDEDASEDAGNPEPQQQMTPPQVQPGQDMSQMQVPQAEPLMAHKTYSGLYNLFYESTYRTAPYWKEIEKPAGKNKNQLTELDILKVRKRFVSRPYSEYRNKVLRSLDKGAAYFIRKLKKVDNPLISKTLTGEEPQSPKADEFKEKYRSIGSLVPSDYAERQPVPNSDMIPEPQADPGQSEKIKLSDFDFDDISDSDAYDHPEDEDI